MSGKLGVSSFLQKILKKNTNWPVCNCLQRELTKMWMCMVAGRRGCLEEEKGETGETEGFGNTMLSLESWLRLQKVVGGILRWPSTRETDRHAPSSLGHLGRLFPAHLATGSHWLSSGQWDVGKSDAALSDLIPKASLVIFHTLSVSVSTPMGTE